MPDTEADSKPDPTYHLDRPSRRTAVEREAHFKHWWSRQEPYRAAVVAAGDKPWTQDIDEARELFYRRYSQPEPPAYLSVPDIRKSA